MLTRRFTVVLHMRIPIYSAVLVPTRVLRGMASLGEANNSGRNLLTADRAVDNGKR